MKTLDEIHELAENHEKGARLRFIFGLLTEGDDPILPYANAWICAEWIFRNKDRLREVLK